MTSGALVGYTAVVLRDLTGNTARISNWWLPTGAPAANGTFALAGNGVGASPQNGDTFEIIDSAVTLAGTYRHAGNPVRLQVDYVNVRFASFANLVVEGADVRFALCQIATSLQTGRGGQFNSAVRFYGCFIQTLANPGRITNFDLRIRFVGCGLLSSMVSCFNTGRCEIILQLRVPKRTR